MRLLDLFCGAGGAAVGYSQAGFTEIVGVDIVPQPNYPFDFLHEDALDTLGYIGQGEFDLIHASPPCQAHVPMAANRWGNPRWPDLIPPTRVELVRLGVPYVIENVFRGGEQSPLADGVDRGNVRAAHYPPEAVRTGWLVRHVTTAHAPPGEVNGNLRETRRTPLDQPEGRDRPARLDITGGRRSRNGYRLDDGRTGDPGGDPAGLYEVHRRTVHRAEGEGGSVNINELRVVNDELGIGVLTERKVSEVELLGLAVQLLKDRFEVEEATKFMPITIREPGRYLVVPLNLLEDES